MKITVNENLVADYLYEQVKNAPAFSCMSLDRQGEVIVEVVNAVDKVMEKLFPPINFSD